MYEILVKIIVCFGAFSFLFACVSFFNVFDDAYKNSNGAGEPDVLVIFFPRDYLSKNGLVWYNRFWTAMAITLLVVVTTLSIFLYDEELFKSIGS